MVLSKSRILLALLLVMTLSIYAQSKNKESKTKVVVATDKGSKVSEIGEPKDSKVKANKKLDLSIKKLSIKTEETPSFKSSKKGSKGASDDWLVVEAEIEMEGQKWLDEIEARWSVLIFTDSSEKPHLLEQSTRFVNIEKGKNRISAFVNPTFFRRYMKSEKVKTSRISAKVEILVNGKVEARKTTGKNTDYMSKKNKCIPEGNSLLPRSKTPFAQIDFDYYATEKQE